jgi:hypothetical protein
LLGRRPRPERLVFAGFVLAAAMSAPAAQEERPPGDGPSGGIDCRREMLAGALSAHIEDAGLEVLSSSDFGAVDFQPSAEDGDAWVVIVRTTDRATAAVTTTGYEVEAGRRCRIAVEPYE